MAPRWSAEGVLTVKANTALLMIFAGSALLLLAVKDALGWRRRAGALLSTLIFLIGSLTLSEHLFGWNLGIDQLLAKEAPGAISTVSPNRMGPPASVCNIIIGAALLLVSFRRLTAVPYMGLAVCIINIIPAVGFLYNIQQFYTTPHLTHIAWPTVIALMCLGTGLVLSQPQSNPLSMLLNDNAGGRLLRQMLPLVILVPLMLGFLRVMGENRGLGDIGTGTGLLVIAIILVFSVILWRSAGKLSYADAAHREDEEALASSALFPEENPNPVLRIGTDGQMLYTNAAARKFLSHEGWMPGVPVPHVLSVLVEEALHSNQVGQFDFLSQVDRVFSFFCVPIPDKHYANLYGWDITDRKMAEDALKESEEKFKSLAENIPSVLQRFDRQFRVVYLSPKAEEATGIPAE
ncbi:MAG: PAS domain-containing protein [Thermoplasmata archaeon]|nr:PAS domain-containing protein [Thermoplasmata archaeon]